MCNVRMYNDMVNEVYLLDTKKGGKYFVGKKLGRAGDSYKILDISRDGTYGKNTNMVQFGMNEINFVEASKASRSCLITKWEK